MANTSDSQIRDAATPSGDMLDERASSRWMGVGTVAWWSMLFVQFAIIIGVAIGWKHGAHWFLLVVATGGSSAGLLLGFLYSSYGSEKDEFKPYYNALSGVVGGASGADLLRGDQSVILRALRSTALACGVPHGAGLVGLIFLSGLTSGFIGLYFIRKLGLNNITARRDSALEAFIRKGGTPSDDAERLLNDSAGLTTSSGDSDVDVATAKAVADDPAITRSDDADKLAIGARAALQTSAHAKNPSLRRRMESKAVDFAQRAVDQQPENLGYLQTMANAQINKRDYAGARATLEQLLNHHGAPDVALKTLAFVLLHLEAYPQAEETIQKYLRTRPNDEVAKLTLLAALAGQWKNNSKSSATADRIVALTKELQSSELMRNRIATLSADSDEELSVLRTDPALSERIKIARP